jgi:TRAP-type transport system periplasmic protein
MCGMGHPFPLLACSMLRLCYGRENSAIGEGTQVTALSAPRRAVLQAAGGLAGILALGRAPAFAQTAPKKLVFAHINPTPESAAVAFDWFAKEVTQRSKGELEVEFHGSTLLAKEVDIMNAVKSGNIAIGNPAGAVATIFPEMGVFLVPYLVTSYDQAYRLLNGPLGDRLDQTFQEKYGVKRLCFFDYGFRHFWNSRRPINEPRDVRGMKLRAQPSKIFADTINGLGGIAVPMPWSEVITAAQQGVIDGADLPVVNMVPLKAYEVSKYFSMTAHNYAPTVNVMNLGVWNGLTESQRTLITDVSMQAQQMIRSATEGVDNPEKAKQLLEPLGMTVNAPNRAPFKKVAQDKIWPVYQKMYPELWEQIVAAPA